MASPIDLPTTDRNSVEGSVKPLERPQAKLALLGASVAVVLMGLALAPERGQVRTLPPEPVAPMLIELVEPRDPLAALRQLRSLASDVSAYVVSFPPPPALRSGTDTWHDWRILAQPGLPAPGFGLIISPDGDVLSDVAGIGWSPVVEATLANGRRVPGRVRAYDEQGGLVLLRLEASSLPVPPMAAESAGSGDLVLAAGQTPGGEILAPAFVVATTPEDYQLTWIPGASLAGAPLFNTDGEALGIVTGGENRARRAGPAIDRLREIERRARPLPTVTGLALQEISGSLVNRFASPGVLVSDVAPRSPADAAGARAGDVLVRIDGQAVSTVADARARLSELAAGEPAAFAVRRGTREVLIRVTPEIVLEARWARGASGRDISTLPLSRELFSSEALAAAGVPEEARVLRIDGRAPRPTVRPRGAVLAHFDHQGQRFFAVIGSGS